MRFEVYGSFEIPRTKKGRGGWLIEKGDLKGFWDQVEEFEPGLTSACGCYVFALTQPYGFTPYYVGKTERRDFRGECFQSAKLLHYNGVLSDKKGAPVLFLIAHRTPQDRFRKPTIGSNPAVAYLETMLIGMGLTVNSDLRNKQGTKFLKEIEVRGVFNSVVKGPPPKAARDLKKALGLA